MNKLVSRNPILRFLYGKKILDTLAGIVSSQPTPLLPAYIMYKGYKKVQNDFDKIKKREEYNLKIDNNNKRLSNKYNLTYHPKFEKVGDRKPVSPNNKKESFKTACANARNKGLETFNWRGLSINTKAKGEENFVFENGKWIDPTKKIGTFTISDINPEAGEITPSEANAPSRIPETPIIPTLLYTPTNYYASNTLPNLFGQSTLLFLLLFAKKYNLKPSLNFLYLKKGGLISKNPINRFKNGSSFGKAFKAARALGLKEFTWNGNRYTTKTKEEELNNKTVNPFLKAEEEFQKKYKYQYNPYNSMTIYTNKNSGNKYLTSKTGRKADIIRT